MDSATRQALIADRFLVSIPAAVRPDVPHVFPDWTDEPEQLTD
jgi:hypothetical protein